MSSVKLMICMFEDAASFNQAIDKWRVASVESFTCMFSGTTAFNQPIAEWDIFSAENMWDMFEGATSFNQDLCSCGATFRGDYHSTYSMFVNTSCPDTRNPMDSEGPFCWLCTILKFVERRFVCGIIMAENDTICPWLRNKKFCTTTTTVNYSYIFADDDQQE